MLTDYGEMIKKQTIEQYCMALASKLPTPGGGGASAVAGALGCSLGLMVIAFTLGKKRYAEVEEDLKKDQEMLTVLREDFFRLAKEDELAFTPVASAYKLSEETEELKAEKQKIMEDALVEAARVPLRIMERSFDALEVMQDIAEKGSKLAVSDAGVGGDYLSAALKGASLNVLINAKSMKEKAHQDEFVEKCADLLEKSTPIQEKISSVVLKRI